MSTTALIVNIVLIAAVTAIVAVPAVLIPLLLDREPRPAVRVAPAARTAARERIRAAAQPSARAA